MRLKPAPEPVVRFATEPGAQAQVDFAEFPFPRGKRYALLVVLGYSRLLWLRFYATQDMPTLLAGLEEAFRFFEGVPARFSSIRWPVSSRRTSATREVGSSKMRSSSASRLTGASASGPVAPIGRGRRAKWSGRSASLHESFVYAGDFVSDEDLNAQAEEWLRRVANVRVHWTTLERPIERFTEAEQPMLQPRALRVYQSLILPKTPPRSRRPAVPGAKVERRPLTTYAAIAAGAL